MLYYECIIRIELHDLTVSIYDFRKKKYRPDSNTTV